MGRPRPRKGRNGIVWYPMRVLPPTLTTAIWTLRSVPIVVAILVMISETQESTNPLLWMNVVGLMGIIAALFYLDRQQRLSWSVGQIIYAYVFVALILQDPQGLIVNLTTSTVTQISWQEMVHLLWVIASLVVVGLAIEALVEALERLTRWAWWLAMGLALVYILSMVFFLPGTLSLWCLYHGETRAAFRKQNYY
jgi:hypothetical protein